MHKTTTTDDKRLQNTLKRLGVNTIPGIEEVNLFKEENVIHFTNPKGASGGGGRGARVFSRDQESLRARAHTRAVVGRGTRLCFLLNISLSSNLFAERSASLDCGQHLRRQRAVADEECVVALPLLFVLD